MPLTSQSGSLAVESFALDFQDLLKLDLIELTYATEENSMPSQTGKRIGPGPNNYLQLKDSRGAGYTDNWFAYSTRMDRKVALKSDNEWEHFLWLEGDPSIAWFELEPLPCIVIVDGEQVSTQFDALVKFRSGIHQYREVSDDDAKLDSRKREQRDAQIKAAGQRGFDYRRITKKDLQNNVQLIKNWSTARAALESCRGLDLISLRREIVSELRRLGRCTLDAIVKRDPSSPERLAALLRAIQLGEVQSDLEYAPLCAKTIIYIGADGNNA